MSDLRERVAHAMWHQGVDAAIAIVLEEAARCADIEGMYYTGLREGIIIDRIAAAIRALKEKT